MSPEGGREDIARRVDAIEAGYELMLGYAAQGLSSDQGSGGSAQLREFLKRFDEALTGLAGAFQAVVVAEGRGPQPAIDAFLEVLAKDAAAAQASLRMVLGQKGISSQLIDNLNASIHVRALLTDLFLIDELLKSNR